MQRIIDDKIHLGKTVTPFDSIGNSDAIDRTASHFKYAHKKVQKMKKTYQQKRI